MQSDKDKAQEIVNKRRLAAKGLKERKDGKPIDPMEDIGTLAIDTEEPQTPEEKQTEIARRGLALGLGMRR